MIPVEQRLLHDAETGKLGDCMKCCVASILELDYDDVPHFVQMDDWHGEYRRFLHARGWSTFPILGLSSRDDDVMKPSSWPSEGYWLASVLSPRTQHEDGSRGIHMVVMEEDRLAWDPHPQRADGHLGFIDGVVLRAIDPARFVLRTASEGAVARAARRLVNAEAEGNPALVEDAHFQLLRALCDYEAAL